MKHTAKTAMRLLGAVLLLAGLMASFTAGPASAQDGPTLTAEPATVAGPGEQEFTVTGSGFTVPVFVLECIVVVDLSAINSATDCDLQNLVSVTPEDGGFTASITIDVPAEGMSIVAGDAAQTEVGYINIAVEGAAEEAPSGPALTAEPAMAVPGETEFTVTGSGFTKDVFLLSCIPTEDPSTLDSATDCNLANLVPASPDDSGSFTATITVDVPAEGISLVAGDAEQTESGFVNVAIDEEALAAAEAAAQAEAEAAAEAEAEAAAQAEAEAAAKAEEEAAAAAAAEAEAAAAAAEEEAAAAAAEEEAAAAAAADDDSNAGLVFSVIVVALVVVVGGVLLMRRRSS